MKINCNFCGTAFNDTEEMCPHCGAPNAGIVRTASDQPITIEQLKKWYEDRGLPPYNVTRFFIGEDYKEPRAFGIFKNEDTGVCTVYKNKDNGERAIRYEGTDEAYAVNELYQRLKQEIIQQKMHSVKSGNSNIGSTSKTSYQEEDSWFKIIWMALKSIFIAGALFIAGIFALFVVIGLAITATIPKEGYYQYEGKDYYFDEDNYAGYTDANYYVLDNGQWTGPFYREEVPEKMQSRRKAKKYLVSKSWNEELKVPDFAETDFAADIAKGFVIDIGYYEQENNTYYNLGGWFDSYWYIFDGEWKAVDYDSLPYELKHPSISDKYYVSSKYKPDISAEDFTKSIYYADYNASEYIDTGYYSCDGRDFYHVESYYSDGWYEYDSNDWSNVDYGDLPDDLKHNSIVTDFYYTPTWDASTQITDFTTSYAYEEYQDSLRSSSTSDDSDYDWGSSDSWDSGSTDFSSDW